MLNSSARRVKGFTLAEAMIAAVVLCIATSAVVLPFVSGASVRLEGVRRTLSAKLAGDLLEEIVNMPSDSIISTYDGYSEPAGQVKDSNGVVFTDSNYTYFSREASCELVRVAQQDDDAEPAFIRVTVRIYHRGRQMVSVSRLVSK